jgi:hypothetical protein
MTLKKIINHGAHRELGARTINYRLSGIFLRSEARRDPGYSLSVFSVSSVVST